MVLSPSPSMMIVSTLSATQEITCPGGPAASCLSFPAGRGSFGIESLTTASSWAKDQLALRDQLTVYEQSDQVPTRGSEDTIGDLRPTLYHAKPISEIDELGLPMDYILCIQPGND